MSESTMTTQRADDLPERWSAQRKTEIVLRVIRGEAIDEVAREIARCKWWAERKVKALPPRPKAPEPETPPKPESPDGASKTYG